METAIAYIRVSDPKQVTDGNSLVTQEKQVREHASARGYNLLRVFIEEGETAKSDERTVLQQMLAFCRANQRQIQVLIFPKIDRFARYLPDYIALKNQLAKLGIRVDSVGEPIQDTPAGRLTEFMLAAIAQFDNEVRSERSKGGMIQAVREGRKLGVAPFGYRNVRFAGKATAEPNPETEPIVVEVFNRLASGNRPVDVHRWLTTQGYRFSRAYFHHLVRNRIYIGLIDMFGETNIAAPPCLPLVSEAVFYAAQRAFLVRRLPKHYDRDNPSFPLRGTLKCVCGRYLMAGWAQGRTKKYGHYRCSNCPRVNHPREDVHRQFCVALRAARPSKSAIDRVRQYLKEITASMQCRYVQRREIVDQHIANADSLRRAIVTKNAAGVIPDDLAKREISDLEAKIGELKAELASLAVPADIEDLITFSRWFFESLDVAWLNAYVVEQKKLQRFAFPDGLTITHDGEIRTAKKERHTGLKCLSHSMKFPLVHRTNTSQNPVRTEKRDDTEDRLIAIIQFLREVYQHFGAQSRQEQR